ncbi:MAG: hypothetical protein O2794_00380 [bacterium]|nr:hypothetical protein [bacterium]
MRGLLLAPIFLLACARVVSHDDFLRTEQLSRDVKKFGESIGIDSTKVLTKSYKKGERVFSFMWIWVQKNGVISAELVDRVYIKIEGLVEDTNPLEHPRVKKTFLKYSSGYSLFYRHENQSSSTDSLITPSFVRERQRRQVEVILHEDLHHSVGAPYRIDESISTALGHLATVKFFENIGDATGLEEAKSQLRATCRGPSRDLNTFVVRARRLFATFPLKEARSRIRSMIRSYPSYYRYRWPITKDGSPVEAMLSHDLVYLKYCDSIVELYEHTGGDLKSIITFVRTIPDEITDEEFEDLLLSFRVSYVR